MEWYDFVTFAYLATYISPNFFPSMNETTGLLATFATFGVGFITRPLGSYVFGCLGDKRGRKFVLTITIFLMAAATGIIGILPVFENIGYAAPLVLLFARLAQGFSAGGEGTTGMIYAVEWAPSRQRGYFGSLQVAGSGFGLLLGSATVTVLLSMLDKSQMLAWGWRVPFLLGLIIGPIGVWIRRSIEESPTFLSVAKHPSFSPPQSNQWKPALQLFALNSAWGILYYVFLSFMPTFSQKYLHLTGLFSIATNTLSLLVYIALIPLFGRLSDRVGRKPLLLTSCLGFAFLSYPLFKLLVSGAGLLPYIVIVCLFALLLAMFSGPAVATFAELFPTRSRSKLLSTSYGLSVATFGGFTPYVATWLIKVFSSPLAPTGYIILGGLIGAATVISLKETAHSDLA